MPKVYQKIKIGDGGQTTVQIYELSVADIRRKMNDEDARLAEQQNQSADADIDILNYWLYSDLSFDDIYVMTDLTPEDIETLYQSDLDKVRATIKRANADFFDMRARMKQGMEHLAKLKGQQDNQNPSASDASDSRKTSPG